MAFVAPTTSSAPASNKFTPLYQAGKQTQTQFQCGWNASYLQSRTDPTPLTFTRFGQPHVTFSTQGTITVPAPTTIGTQLAAESPKAPTPVFFMAGRRGCGFVTKAMKEHAAQSVKVAALDCMDPTIQKHPVCQMNAAARRGTPSYYKQTGPNEYEFIRSGFSQDLSFLQ